MLTDFTGADRVYIACGYTDLRRGIDGLAVLVQQQFNLDLFTNTLFLFCGRRRDRIKALYWEGNGFVLLYKRLESGSFQWPKKENEARALTPQQYRWLMDGIPVEQAEHRLEGEGLVCPECGDTMTEIGKEVVRTLEIIPTQMVVREDIYYTYACKNCSENADEGCETPVVKAPWEKNIIPGSFATPEAIAHIMTQKFVMGCPLYRQEQEINRKGIKLSRQTMSNWILKAAADYLTPVYEQLHRNC